MNRIDERRFPILWRKRLKGRYIDALSLILLTNSRNIRIRPNISTKINCIANEPIISERLISLM